MTFLLSQVKKNLHSTDDRFVATCIWYLLYLAWDHPKHTLNSNSHSLSLYFEIYVFQQCMRTNYIQYIYIYTKALIIMSLFISLKCVFI